MTVSSVKAGLNTTTTSDDGELVISSAGLDDLLQREEELQQRCTQLLLNSSEVANMTLAECEGNVTEAVSAAAGGTGEVNTRKIVVLSVIITLTFIGNFLVILVSVVSDLYLGLMFADIRFRIRFDLDKRSISSLMYVDGILHSI